MGGSGSPFLDDSVEKDDFLPMDDEENPGDPLAQRRADFPESLSHRVNQGLSDRPFPLNG
jgi:hypothetical protein